MFDNTHKPHSVRARACWPASGFLAAVLALAMGLPISAVSAQNALGDGRALDNSLSTRGRYNRSRPSLREEFAFRNSIVTGNAPNGMSFRGDVGYRAPGEFEGLLGSNDQFAFRRDSLRSGMAGMGIRGTEALQYQLALTTGSRPPSNLIGRYSVSRSGASAPVGAVSGQMDQNSTGGLQQRPSIDPDSDGRGTLLWMLRSPSAYISNSSLQASVLGRGAGETDVYAWTASPLRGIRLSPIPELTAARAAALKAEAEAEEESGFGRVNSDETETPAGGIKGARPGDRSGSQTERVSTLHSDIVGRLREVDTELQNDVFESGTTMSDRIKAMRLKLLDAAEAEDGESEDGESRNSGSVRFDSETMQLLRGDGTPLSRFVDSAATSRSVYAGHLTAGQDLLAQGRYFDAEERFASALGIRRGDVTAQIGRLHAQIGAGLYLSASLNLQALAAASPEIFATKYAAELLPTPERIEGVIAVMEEMIDGSTDLAKRSSPQVRGAAGLLLGYLGYQLDRGDLVEAGMQNFIDGTTRGMQPGDPRPPEARIGDLLLQMWTVEKSDG